MKRRIAWLALLGVSLTACDKPAKTAAPKVAPPPPTATGEPGTADPAPAPAAGVPPQVAALNAIQRDLASADPEVYLPRLTELLNAWVMSKNGFPQSVDDFVKTKMIPKLPAPPPGKKLAIDRQGMRVVLADQ